MKFICIMWAPEATIAAKGSKITSQISLMS